MTNQENDVINKLINGNYDTLHNYCKEWRESKGYTQEYIALKGKTSKSTVSRFESGTIISNKALSGYTNLGMPIPYDLMCKYLKGR